MLSAFLLKYRLMLYAIMAVSTVCPISTATAQSKFFSTPSRGGAEGAKQTAQVVTLQSENQRMNACTAQGLIYGPTNPNADAGGCLPRFIIHPDHISIAAGTGSSSSLFVHVDGTTNSHSAALRLIKNYNAQTGGGPGIRFDNLDGRLAAIFGTTDGNLGGIQFRAGSDGNQTLMLLTAGGLTVNGDIGVTGAIKVGNATTCNASTEGSLRYNAAEQKMELCSGSAWVGMSGGGQDGMPSGAVMAFNLSSCPSGWSPLIAARGRFVIGTGTLGSDTYSLGATGGSARHTLTISEMPSHTHKHPYSVEANIAGGSLTRATLTGSASNGLEVTQTGGNQPHENRPPYLALLYCEKDWVSGAAAYPSCGFAPLK